MDVRFVVLRHEAIDQPHFDLMIESEPGGKLLTWRIDTWPIVGACRAEPLELHRREYLVFEGDLSRNRGSVRRVAEGSCSLRLDENRWRAALSNGTTLTIKTIDGKTEITAT